MITRTNSAAAVKIAVHELGPRKRLRLPKGEHALVVEEGVLLVTFADRELALIRGDEVVVRRGELREARNATGTPARVLALSRAA
jgi:mannose-6-phosphate isomerase-like protein (cupin superfamily)